jgi:hypothetical protein
MATISFNSVSTPLFHLDHNSPSRQICDTESRPRDGFWLARDGQRDVLKLRLAVEQKARRAGSGSDAQGEPEGDQ